MTRFSLSTPTAVFAVISAAASLSSARDVPENVRAFYNKAKADKCQNKLASGFFSSSDENKGHHSYCGDAQQASNVVFLSGGSDKLVNMDVCCDGRKNSPFSDGRCDVDPSYLGQTAFKDDVKKYHKGVSDLDAYVHPYVVFGNTGHKPGWPTFHPKHYGIEPLSVMAVICGDKLIYGIWGDTNGQDGDHAMVGEASLSLATACYGHHLTGDRGHDENDVLYVGFSGHDAVPGADGAKWDAKSYDEFEASISGLGDRLIERLRAW